ncbi:IclR family transcriptional regulator [uncultured Roseobacter sp.]|uniref:IclR family transcriptional regulator n=1 Tax=uncultured Roseobacter sp. TaxID=114847 RepID=UPI002608298E|nr:IclR family transcriptional regulator [uncultured Roseobacter sp.]
MRSETDELNVQETHKTQGIQVISRAADILRVLGANSGGLSLGQIARKVDLPRSTVQRIVSALIHEGLVASDGGSGGLRLGDEIRVLANAPAFDLREHFRPLLDQIAAATSETVDLAVLEGANMRFIDQIEGRQRLRTVSTIGDRFPLTTTANGKAALAELSETSARALISAELGSDDGVDALMDELRRIRDGEIATDLGEHSEEICALGFAVIGPNKEIAAISVPVPSSRFYRIRADLTKKLDRIRG